MKSILIIPLWLLFANVLAVAQENSNLKNGYAAQGYDVVGYFQNKIEKGDPKYNYSHNGVNYKFHNAENLSTFQKNPQTYVPQYGGFCAYAIAKNGKKVGVNPKTFTISDGKLYLFYNRWGVNTLEKWNDEGPETLQIQADLNWETLLNSQ